MSLAASILDVWQQKEVTIMKFKWIFCQMFYDTVLDLRRRSCIYALKQQI